MCSPPQVQSPSILFNAQLFTFPYLSHPSFPLAITTFRKYLRYIWILKCTENSNCSKIMRREVGQSQNNGLSTMRPSESLEPVLLKIVRLAWIIKSGRGHRGRGVTGWEALGPLCWLQRCMNGPWTEECRQPLEAKTGKQTGSSLELWEEIAQEDLFQTCDLQKRNIINMCYFKQWTL